MSYSSPPVSAGEQETEPSRKVTALQKESIGGTSGKISEKASELPAQAKAEIAVWLDVSGTPHVLRIGYILYRKRELQCS